MLIAWKSSGNNGSETRACGEKARRLAGADPYVVVNREIERSALLELDQLAFHHSARDVDENIQDLEIVKLESNVKSRHVHPVAGQYGDLVTPLGIRRSPASSDLGVVNDVVMDERCDVNQFNYAGQLHGSRSSFPRHFRTEEQRGRTEPFSPAAVHIGIDTVDKRYRRLGKDLQMGIDLLELLLDQAKNISCGGRRF